LVLYKPPGAALLIAHFVRFAIPVAASENPYQRFELSDLFLYPTPSTRLPVPNSQYPTPNTRLRTPDSQFANSQSQLPIPDSLDGTRALRTMMKSPCSSLPVCLLRSYFFETIANNLALFLCMLRTAWAPRITRVQVVNRFCVFRVPKSAQLP